MRKHLVFKSLHSGRTNLLNILPLVVYFSVASKKDKKYRTLIFDWPLYMWRIIIQVAEWVLLTLPLHHLHPPFLSEKPGACVCVWQLITINSFLFLFIYLFLKKWNLWLWHFRAEHCKKYQLYQTLIQTIVVQN